jgi:hypothetical protein
MQNTISGGSSKGWEEVLFGSFQFCECFIVGVVHIWPPEGNLWVKSSWVGNKDGIDDCLNYFVSVAVVGDAWRGVDNILPCVFPRTVRNCYELQRHCPC